MTPQDQSSKQNNFEMDDLARRLEIIVQNLLSKTPSTTPSPFSRTKVPLITPGKYIERIMQYCPTSRSAWIVSFIYLRRYLRQNGADSFHVASVHRLLMTCVALGSKYCDDHFKKNTFYARVGGFTVEEFNTLEVEMLMELDHRLYVTTSEFEHFENYLRSPIFEVQEEEEGEEEAQMDNTENETPVTNNTSETTTTNTTLNNTKPSENIEIDLNEKDTSGKAPFFRVELEGLLVAPKSPVGPHGPFSSLRQFASLFAF